jgi:hypothetical protein
LHKTSSPTPISRSLCRYNIEAVVVG